MRYYIATTLKNVEEHHLVRDYLNDYYGWTLTYDWTAHGSVLDNSLDVRQRIALTEEAGIRSADVVVAILPGGRGTHIEIGFAIAYNKPVILYANKESLTKEYDLRCVFYDHPLVTRVDKMAANIIKAVKDGYLG